MNISNLIHEFLVAHKTLAKLLKMPYSPFQNGIPMILPSSGSMADNGAITLATALPAIYTSCYLYLPANAIEAGSTAGLYYTVMSSTTAGTVYSNKYTSGEASIPASPTALSTTGPGAYTQTTATDISLLTNTLPGGSLGKSGVLFCFPMWAINNSGNTKTTKHKINAVDANTLGFTTSTGSCAPYMIRNCGAFNKNISNSSSAFSPNGVAPVDLNVDTSANVIIELAGRLSNAADYLILAGVTYQINP